MNGLTLVEEQFSKLELCVSVSNDQIVAKYFQAVVPDKYSCSLVLKLFRVVAVRYAGTNEAAVTIVIAVHTTAFFVNTASLDFRPFPHLVEYVLFDFFQIHFDTFQVLR